MLNLDQCHQTYCDERQIERKEYVRISVWNSQIATCRTQGDQEAVDNIETKPDPY